MRLKSSRWFLFQPAFLSLALGLSGCVPSIWNSRGSEDFLPIATSLTFSGRWWSNPNTCSALPTYLNLLDQNGDSMSPTTPIEVTLSGLGTVTIHPNDPTCGAGTAATTFNLQTSGSSATLYFTASSSQTVTMTASPDTSLNSPTFRLTIGTALGFATSDSYSAYAIVDQSNPQSMAVADFDNDGLKDVVVGYQGGTDSNSHLSLLRGKEDLSLGSPEDVIALPALNIRVTSVGAADFDDDGNMDVAVSSYTSQRIYVYLGDGEGGFSLSYSSAALSGISVNDLIKIYDLDGTNGSDIILSASSDTSFTVFLSDGDGTFTAVPKVTTTGCNVKTVAVGQFNTGTDSFEDLGLICFGTPSELHIYLGAGDGTFSAGNTYTLTGWDSGWRILVTRLNADINDDIVVGRFNGASILTITGNGDGTFNAPVAVATDATTVGLIAGDFDGDGDNDVATATKAGGHLRVFSNDGAGTLTATIDYDTDIDNPQTLLYEDMDGDGEKDLVVDAQSFGVISIKRGIPN